MVGLYMATFFSLGLKQLQINLIEYFRIYFKTMQPKPGRFIDPLSDFGFKHLFGNEPNQGYIDRFPEPVI
jgi:hypothetical protein